VYTARIRVRHHELDQFGRVHPAVYLRWLAHTAVDASAAAGFDARWYVAAGALWLVRRSSLVVHRPAVADETLEIRTWVEDFRRVRSHRRYEVRDDDGALRLDARTDWVYVDAATGRPRRVPAEIEAAFLAGGVPAQAREPWHAPPPPPAPWRGAHRVRAYELDSLAHMNNAVYLDLAAQAVLDALADAGWPLDRLTATGTVPVLGGADLEYLEAARYGDRLDLATWFSPAGEALDAHQTITRAGDARSLVQATTRWRWTDLAGTRVPLPDGALSDLRPWLVG
jgi:acyl-CoA thioester hydrolase